MQKRENRQERIAGQSDTLPSQQLYRAMRKYVVVNLSFLSIYLVALLYIVTNSSQRTVVAAAHDRKFETAATGGSNQRECPCSDVRLCKPIETIRILRNKKSLISFDLSNNIKHENKEVVGFTMATQLPSMAFEKLTTIIVFSETNADSILCMAHSHGVRVIIKASAHLEDFESAASIGKFVQNVTARTTHAFADGVNFDFEGALLDKNTAFNYSKLVQETTRSLKELNPYSQVSVDVPWSPDGIDNRYFDWLGLAQAADFLFVMAYDMRSQIWDQCIASANSPLMQSEHGIQQYLELGINEDQIVWGMPWYGYDYLCTTTNLSLNYCAIQQIPFRGAPCSDAAGDERCLSNIISILSSTSVQKTQPELDPLLNSTSFFYFPSTNESRQMWYDDVESLSIKYMSAATMRLRGIGFWNIDCIEYNSKVESVRQHTYQMLKAIDVFTHYSERN